MSLQGVNEFFTILMDERMEIRIAPAALDGSGKPVELNQTTQGRLSRIDAIFQQNMAKAGSNRLTIQLQRIKAALDRYEAKR